MRYLSIHDDYFRWLYGLVGLDNERYSKFWRLLGRLYNKEFYWTIPNDDNRLEDGLYLRTDYAEDRGYVTEDVLNVLDGPCTVLEMMVALAIRAKRDVCDDYIDDHNSIFWDMINNLGFCERRFQDGYFGPKEIVEVDEKLEIMMNRSYDKTGKGGLFPLKNWENDQRRVEIWYQMQKYVLENYVF